MASFRAVTFASRPGMNWMCTARVRTIGSSRPVSSGESHNPSSSRTSSADVGIRAVRCRHDDAASSSSGMNGSGDADTTSVHDHSSWDGNQHPGNP